MNATTLPIDFPETLGQYIEDFSNSSLRPYASRPTLDADVDIDGVMVHIEEQPDADFDGERYVDETVYIIKMLDGSAKWIFNPRSWELELD